MKNLKIKMQNDKLKFKISKTLSEDFVGVVIEESLEKKGILKKLVIIKTKVERVVKKHQTPWIKKWTLHTVEIPASQAAKMAKELSRALDSRHAWYADFKNDKIAYIIFRNRIFKINRTSKKQYDKAREYGIFLGIPSYQINFRPVVKKVKAR